MRKLIDKLKSDLLTYLFKDWIEGEYDLETLAMARSMISNREYELKWMLDKVNHVEVKGYRHHEKN